MALSNQTAELETKASPSVGVSAVALLLLLAALHFFVDLVATVVSPLWPDLETRLQLNGGVLNLCLPGCSPLVAGSCPVGETCVAAYEGDTLGGFICFPPAAEGITGESCECANCCAEGNLCTDAATYGPDCAYDLCCTEYCDINDGGFTCAGGGQQCIALFDPNDPNYANVGACQIPM